MCAARFDASEPQVSHHERRFYREDRLAADVHDRHQQSVIAAHEQDLLTARERNRFLDGVTA